MAAHSLISARKTVHFTTSAIDDPCFSSVALIFSRVFLVSAAIPPSTSLDVARRLKDELRMGGAWYVLANCHEARGEWKKAVHYLQKVVRVDEKYQLPKLAENTQRLKALSTRLSVSTESSHE